VSDAAGTRPLRLALVDDHHLFREGIKEMLSTVNDIEVVGEGASGGEALALAVELSPDVLLLDVEMPGPGAVTTIRQVRRQQPGTKIIVLTMHDDARILRELLESGASAYLLKTVLRDELLAAIRSVARSSDNILLAVSRLTMEQLDRHSGTAGGGADALTEREREILALAGNALSNGQIASRLHITEATVKRHLTNAYAKLNAVSRVDAIRKALARRLIPGDQRPPLS
jgi:DNA-binding NarL/FixJ family response regulator